MMNGGTAIRIHRTAAAAVAALALTGLTVLASAHPAAARPRPDGAAPTAPAPTPTAPAPAPAEPCTAGTGPYQRELEEHLELTVDGAQSAQDCAAVREFQKTHRITPADGYAGLTTYRTMIAVQARTNPNAAGSCPVRRHRVTCVDLDRQLLWVQRDTKIVFPPVPIRTGRDDQETRPGWHEVYWRSKNHVSTLYDSPMPYAQFFDRGQALHGRPGDLYAHGGSAGCVNLSVPDAARLWDLLTEGDAVYVWGTKPGTDD
ncbi:L,D-transpeptidase family protein [Streptomyces sp. NPDC051211]|uniref:L,D-transpeptidase family protein n=1 Tax=Streptomyces sp. NPDC051211 TaxID=3154643 RepID=UPI00344B5326